MKILRNLAIVSLVLFVTGCAASRSVVNLETAEEIGNPATGIAVKFVSIEDKREFELDPKLPEIPSISQAEVNNDAIKARAIGRKRNGYGAAMGDILLSEGTTVTSVMTDELIKTFRSAGYRVVTEKDPDFAAASPIEIEIYQFWSWMKWGFTELKVGNVSQLKIKGDLGKSTNTYVVENRYMSQPHMAIFESDWMKDSSNGMKALMAKLKAHLQS